MSVSGETEAREMITFNIVSLHLKHRHKYIYTTHKKIIFHFVTGIV